MENIRHSELSNIRRHRRARHEDAAQKVRFNEHEAVETTATIVAAQDYSISALSKYDQIDVKDEDTLEGSEGYLDQTEVGLPEDEDTLFDDGLGPAEWDPMYSLKYDNDLSHLTPSHSIYRVEAENEEAVLHNDEADYVVAASLCTVPEEEEEEEEAVLCLPQPSFQASEVRSRIFSPRTAVSPGWLSDFINTPINRGDREAKDADWSSIVDYVDFSYEDCHNFIILELGVRNQVPMMYEYAQGIRDVHYKLRLRYGDPGFRKAFAVFQDIMEFKDVGLVHSDEGPQWDSWRGDYRQRLDDILNGVSPAGLMLTNVDRAKRYNDLEKVLCTSRPKANPGTPILDSKRVPQGLCSTSNPSAAERLASQPKPKVRRSQRVDFKTVKDLQKKHYEKEVEISGRQDVTKKLAEAPFVKNLKPNPVKKESHYQGKSGKSGRSSPVTKAERAERHKITPWEKYKVDAPIAQNVIIPACDQDPSTPSVPLVPASRGLGLVAALKKSISNVSFRSLKKKKSSVTLPSVDVKPLKEKSSVTLLGVTFKSLKKKKSSVTVQSEQAASNHDLGLTFRNFEPSLPPIEEVRTTFTTPEPLLGSYVPPRVTQLGSPVHLLTLEEHIAAARQRDGGETPELPQTRQQRIQQTTEVAEQLETYDAYKSQALYYDPYDREVETPEPSAQQGSADDVDPWDRRLTPLLPESILLLPESERRLTPLLPESILLLPESGITNPFHLPDSSITNRTQLPESNLARRRRVVKPDSDDDSDDTIVPAPRPRVPRAQRDQDYGWHVPGDAPVRLRPRRAPDPMTPSQEMMAFMQPHHIEGGFDPVSFGLGPRDRPENVLVTQHKVKQVYIQQPGLWTPKTSEIDF